MTVRQFILRPVARAAAIRAAIETRAFRKAHLDTAGTQDRLLERLLTEHAETSFGRDHDFANIRTHADFKSAVPIRSYEQCGEYFQRVLDGEFTALLPPGRTPLMFSMTSGTTGQPKYIPVTPEFLQAMRAGFNILGLSMLTAHKDGWLQPILQITSPMDDHCSPTGLPCGAISGFIAAHQQKIVRRMYPAPPEAAGIKDPAAKYYTLMRCGVTRPTSIITTANPSSIVHMIETAQQHAETLIRDVADGTYTPPAAVCETLRQGLHFKPDKPLAARIAAGIATDGCFLPRHVWHVPFLACWTGGTLQLYLRRLRELFGEEIPIRDIGLLASEGRFSIPLTDHTPAGVAEIVHNVLEFIPADQHGKPDADTLRAHEVEIGHEYFLVVTNFAGLWRYHLDDRVRIVARHGQSPVFEFLSRGPHTANLTGEKLTEYQIVEAMRRTAAAMNLPVQRFTLQPIFAHPPCYELVFESVDGVDPAAVARSLDAALAELNIEYQTKRHSGRLAPIRAVARSAQQFEKTEQENIRLRHGRSEQYKHQYLLTDVRDET